MTGKPKMENKAAPLMAPSAPPTGILSQPILQQPKKDEGVPQTSNLNSAGGINFAAVLN